MRHRLSSGRAVLRPMNCLSALIALSYACSPAELKEGFGPSQTYTQVRVSPASAAVVTGGEQDFNVKGQVDGNWVSAQAVWTATGGSVTPTGTFTAGATPGTFAVIATSGDVADTSSVVIDPPAPILTAVVLNPAATTVEAGGTAQFAATGLISDGSNGAVKVTFSATGGTVSSTGVYTAGNTAGTYRVIATHADGSLADTSLVTVTPMEATVVQILVSPAAVSLQTGKQQQFINWALLSDGTNMVVPVTYSATGGTITPAGLYTAGTTTGTFEVIVTQEGGTLADTGTVTITSAPLPTLTAVILTPATPSLKAGTTRQFAVTGRLSDGSYGAVSVNYTATGGTISAAGLYTAGSTAGSFRVIATQQGGTKADTSTVTITSAGPKLTQVYVAPATVSLEQGGQQQFTDWGLLSNGVNNQITAVYTATGGAVTADGLYTAGATAGTYRVVALEQASGLADTAVVKVLTSISSCTITPVNATLNPGGSKQFTAIPHRSDGSVASAQVLYTATGGTISGSGLYAAGSVTGIFAITATLVNTTIQCSAAVTVAALPSLTSIQISPGATTLTVGGGQHFSALGQYSDGNTGAVSVSWSTANGSISGSGDYTAPGSAGSYKVIAKQAGGLLADTAVVTVTANNPPSGLVHQPAGYSQFFHYTGSSLPSASVGSGAQGGNNGAIWRYDPNGNMSIVSDGSAPSPSSVFRLTYPAGMPAGDTPGMIQAWATGDEHSSTEYSEIYESSWIRIGDNNGFQTQGTLVKIIGYWGVGQRGEAATPNAFLGFIAGNGSTSVMNSWNLGFIQQNFMDRRLDPNVGNKQLVAGRWSHVEMVMRENNPSSAANGVLQVWIDGVMTHNYNNVQFRTPSHPSGFYARRWDPIWGGMGGSNRTRTDYLYIDEIYLSGRQ